VRFVELALAISDTFCFAKELTKLCKKSSNYRLALIFRTDYEWLNKFILYESISSFLVVYLYRTGWIVRSITILISVVHEFGGVGFNLLLRDDILWDEQQ